MRLRVTRDVDSHRVNPNYPTLVVEWRVLEDSNFRIRSLSEADWCPRDEEIIEVVDRMLDLSPTFGVKLAKRIEAKNRILWRLINRYTFSRHKLKSRIGEAARRRNG
jgi:hypothetical protein